MWSKNCDANATKRMLWRWDHFTNVWACFETNLQKLQNPLQITLQKSLWTENSTKHASSTSSTSFQYTLINEMLEMNLGLCKNIYMFQKRRRSWRFVREMTILRGTHCVLWRNLRPSLWFLAGRTVNKTVSSMIYTFLIWRRRSSSRKSMKRGR